VPWKGLSLDNGQHILLGAYSATLRLMELAGVAQKQVLLRIPLQLHMQDELALSASRHLPAPLHIISAFLLAKGLSPNERLAAIRFMAWMNLAKFTLAKDETLQDLLQRKRQPDRLTRLLWEPLCLAALNTPIAEASATVFLNVLRDSLAKSRADSDMLLPRCDLSSLLAEPLGRYIENNGGTVRLDTAITHLESHAEGFHVQTGDKTYATFTHVIAATSPFRLKPFISNLPQLADITGIVSRFQYQPIYTLYLQYPEPAQLAVPMIGFSKDKTAYSQWVFDRGSLCGQPGLLAVVISAEGRHQELSQQELANAVIQEIAQAFPHLPEPLWHKVIAEKRATFACKAGMARPPQKTALSRFYLAGDYTTDGMVSSLYPGTIEGAVRSGLQCANHVLVEMENQK
jgi:squalene-associated FAD-dependent desaturase